MAINEIKLYRVDGDTRAVVGDQEVAPESILPIPNLELPEAGWFTPGFELGAKGETGHNPIIGVDGICTAVYYTEPKKGFTVVEIWFDIRSGKEGYDLGVGTGGYEILFPGTASRIIPDRCFAFSGHGSLWIKGGQSSWDCELKWSDREFVENQANAEMKIIIFAGGFEWTKVYPRSISEFKLTGHMRYWVVP